MNWSEHTNEFEGCKYRNKRVIKTVNDLNELIKNYGRTNEKLNTLIIKKDKTKAASFFKSLTFYIFTQITRLISVFLVIFFVGYLIGYHLSPKSVLFNIGNHNLKIIDNEHAVLYKTENEYILRLDCMVDFTFDYNNLFMGTLISSMLLYYYPANDIGLSENEVCYNEGITKTGSELRRGDGGTAEDSYNTSSETSKRTSATMKELKHVFEKFDKDESLIFLNSSLVKRKTSQESVTYMNDFLFSDLNAYPIGGSAITISAGILRGMNSVNTQISINTIFDKTNHKVIPYLLQDCTKGRIYVQLHFVSNQIKTILFRIKPQKGIFLPFKINCKVIHTENIPTNNEFRSNVIQSYKIQKAAVRRINFFIQ